jgi:hypothetical protein
MNLNPLRNSANRLRWLVCLVAITMAGGCNSQTSPSAKSAPANASAPAADTTPKAYNLTIYGYNYTNTEIGSFEVNGQGGGNVEVSVPDAGGGKSVCCVTVYTPSVQPKKVTIKWTRDLDTWCEQEIVLAPFAISIAKYFEVHFYPDGSIELAVTGESSDSRLKLDRASRAGRYEDEKLNVNNDSKFARCKLGYS